MFRAKHCEQFPISADAFSLFARNCILLHSIEIPNECIRLLSAHNSKLRNVIKTFQSATTIMTSSELYTQFAGINVIQTCSMFIRRPLIHAELACLLCAPHRAASQLGNVSHAIFVFRSGGCRMGMLYGSVAAAAAAVKCILCVYKRKMVLTCMPYMPVKTHISITYA